MAGFVLPELYKKSARMNAISAKYALNKFQHLIKWKKNASIMEFGIADGSNSRISLWPLLPKDYTEFIGTDLSKSMVEYLKKNEVLARSEFSQFDIGCENIPSGFQNRFDHIFSFLTLMYPKNTTQVFRNIYTMLKPNGQTFNIFLPSLPTDPVYRKLSEHPKWGKYDHKMMISPFSSESVPEKCYQNAIEVGGFKNFEFIVEDLTYTFTVEEATGFSLAINMAMSKIPDTEIEEYKEYYLNIINEMVLHDVYDSNGKENKEKRLLKFKLCIFSGTKTDN